MNAEELADALELLADGPPWDTGWLRSLLPELAVRGRIVAQEKGDESGNALSRRIEVEGHESLKGRVKKMVAGLLPVGTEEAPFDLPEGWHWERLGRLAEPKAGFAFKSKHFNHVSDGLPVVRIRDVSSGISETFYSGEYREEFLVEDGDLLVGMDGKFCVAFWRGGRALLNQRVTRLDWYTNYALAKFVHWAFEQRLKDLQGVKAYTTVDHLSGKQIAASVIPLPPLTEQHRIVAKVDELMEHAAVVEERHLAATSARVRLRDAALHALAEAVDHGAVETAWSRIEELFDDLFTEPEDIQPLRQTILQLAVRGRLVAQEEERAGVAERVEGVFQEKLARYEAGEIRRPKPSLPVEHEDFPFRLPNGWMFSRLDSVCEIGVGLTKGRNLGKRKTTHLPYLRVANIQAGRLDLRIIKTIEVPIDEVKKFRVRKNDVLMTEGGDWDKLGRSVVWQGEITTCLHQNHVFKVTPYPSVLRPDWLSIFNNSEDGRRYFQSCAKQTTNLASINKTQLRETIVPLPPVAEQHRIVAKVEELMAHCDTVETSLTEAKGARERFAGSIGRALAGSF